MYDISIHSMHWFSFQAIYVSVLFYVYTHTLNSHQPICICVDVSLTYVYKPEIILILNSMKTKTLLLVFLGGNLLRNEHDQYNLRNPTHCSDVDSGHLCCCYRY